MQPSKKHPLFIHRKILFKPIKQVNLKEMFLQLKQSSKLSKKIKKIHYINKLSLKEI